MDKLTWTPLLVLTLALSCTVMLKKRTYVSSFSPAIQYTYFTVKRPIDPKWYILKDEQSASAALYRKDIRSKTRSFFASAAIKKAPFDVNTQEGFEEAVSTMLARTGDAARYELTDLKTDMVSRQGQWCINFTVTTKDNQASASSKKPVLTAKQGFVCIHPVKPGLIFEAFYSETGREDEVHDKKLREAGRHFLDNIVLELEPGKPVTREAEEHPGGTEGSRRLRGKVSLARFGEVYISSSHRKYGSVNSVIRGSQGKFRACLAAELENTPDLYGTIIFNFIIEHTGLVSKVFVEKSTLHNQPLEECMVECFSKLNFPALEVEKGITTVTYPIIFSSGK